MDVLSDVLASLRLRGGVHFRCEMTAPWGMEVASAPSADFHLIVRGNCWVQTPERKEPIAVQAGDLIAFLHGGAHRLMAAPGTPTRPVGQIIGEQDLSHYGPVIHGGGGQPATLLCGYFEFDRDTLHPLVASLPSFIHLRGTDTTEFAWLQTAVNFMIHETRAARPGSEAVVNRMAGVLFVQMLRAYVEQSGETTLLAATADKQIGAVLELMHRCPQDPWGLDSLARRAGMSRSALAARFHALVGQTPMQYLTLWRMQIARSNLLDTNDSIAAIAERAGYRSEAAFNKTFKRIVGKGPGAYRRESADRRGTLKARRMG